MVSCSWRYRLHARGRCRRLSVVLSVPVSSCFLSTSFEITFSLLSALMVRYQFWSFLIKYNGNIKRRMMSAFGWTELRALILKMQKKQRFLDDQSLRLRFQLAQKENQRTIAEHENETSVAERTTMQIAIQTKRGEISALTAKLLGKSSGSMTDIKKARCTAFVLH